MKNTKVSRIRQNIAMLKQQFLQSDNGLFDQALGEHEIGTVINGTNLRKMSYRSI